MNFAAARANMVESQLRPNKVTDDALLEAFANVPRELFVPPPLRNVAYVDEDVPLGNGRFLMEPMILGRLLQLAAIEASNVVLDVGCATGYGSAIMAQLANTVVAVESDPALAALATAALAELSCDNVAVIETGLELGAPHQAPYHVIVIEGAVEVIPQPIFDQLGEGGRLVSVVNRDGVRRATLFVRTAAAVSSRPAFDAAVPVLPGFRETAGFVF